MREIREIVIHATMTPADQDITLKDLDRKHRQKGWNGCGYHFVIRRSGEVQIGRPVDVAGAHVRGFDKYSIGVCVVGDGTNFTEAQWDALYHLVIATSCVYPNAKIMGHRDCPKTNTTCPGFDVGEWWAPFSSPSQRIDVV